MPTLTKALQRNAEQHGNKIAIRDRELNWTWSQCIERVSYAAGLLRERGIEKGDRYAILAPNSWRQAELTWAGYWAGAIPVPINYRLAAPEIFDILDDAGCKLLAIDPQFAHLLDSPTLQAWQDNYLSLSASLESDANNYDALFSAAPSIAPAMTDENDEAILLYTGGTTGRSKGVPLSHGNILSNARQIGTVWPASEADVVLHLPPMFHSAELVKTVYMLNGASNVYLAKFDPESLLQAIEEFAATFVLMVPTVIKLVLESGLLRKYDLASLKQIIYGASPMSPAWISKTFEAFPGVQIAQGYGLTETAPLLSMLDHHSHVTALGSDTHRLASCGKPLDGIELKIVDERNVELPKGATGEILVRGKNVFRGYLNRPELNEVVLHDGWFHTGDVGYLDEEGYMYLCDRKDDLIITGGEKVYSSEVEAVLCMHPDVMECAVIGVPDTHFGERVQALIVAKPGMQIVEAKLLEHCRQHIGGYKLPRKIELVTDLPKSAMGKTLKSELRKIYNTGSEQ